MASKKHSLLRNRRRSQRMDNYKPKNVIHDVHEDEGASAIYCGQNRTGLDIEKALIVIEEVMR
ncbi:MAG: hypothetical protein ACLQVJ_29665 [Syntrophobacteraceae bacterium]